ncbi:uncharacterized protein LOC129717615 [Wyeomyia smithii]|uniref:uncharacterized protein LOC129717614 n=1 Tax=Wyeomyia smithii TaxID=174621 RepID=UPI002467C1BD|nr:uncharacterized protein LOC129717614 [Wyeomyia smithii]XP_055523622.1 uncharacterized protein LOC129717615 [Wyeomyia smithii]
MRNKTNCQTRDSQLDREFLFCVRSRRVHIASQPRTELLLEEPANDQANYGQNPAEALRRENQERPSREGSFFLFLFLFLCCGAVFQVSAASDSNGLFGNVQVGTGRTGAALRIDSWERWRAGVAGRTPRRPDGSQVS